MAGVETLIRDLRLRRGRERRGLALAEGVRLVEEALSAGVGVRHAAVSPGAGRYSAGRGTQNGADVGRRAAVQSGRPRARRARRHRASPGGHRRHRAAALVARRPSPRARATSSWCWTPCRIPGNVGAIARTALGLGAHGLIALKGTAELTNPKVLRGSMGALFRLPSISSTDDECLGWLKRVGWRSLGHRQRRRASPAASA